MNDGAGDEAFEHTIRTFKQAIRDRLERGDALQEAIERLGSTTRREMAPFPDTLEFRLQALERAAVAIRADLDGVRYLQKAAIRSGRPDWYAGPGDEAHNWLALKARLTTLGRTHDEIDRVDRESTTILSLTDNPGQERFSTRGLVIGHVQSGKTGNMAAVIAKAADTPFKFFIVLSGMTDSLRNQTQARLDEDVVNAWRPDRWYSWTKVDVIENGVVIEKGDFNHPSVGGFQFGGRSKHLAVMKKNAGVLRRALGKLRNTPRSVLQDTPVLIIDDECDQASVNSAVLSTAITTINGLIREIIRILPRVSYIGYTATPFANVLISPSNAADLYPRHFIHPLERPKGYFGAVELFGREALEGEQIDIETGFDMIRLVPDKEAGSLRPPLRGSAGFQFRVTESLDRAIRYFVMTVAARESRGQADEHCSMLLHTSVLNSVHRSAERALRPYLDELLTRLSASDRMLLDGMAEQWDDECARVEASQFGLSRVSFSTIRPRLADVVGAIEVKVENWASDDRMDFSQRSRRYLVVGGNVLARGLTLHGLVVSYFMRSSSQYDTLMQMGRWFGYRAGFEDLPRVWMEKSVRDAFFDLATVEEEIRRDASRYAVEDFTPEQFAVRIRKIPGLAITARAKMRGITTARIGYQGEHVQTIKFLRHDEQWLGDNWDAVTALLEPEETHLAIRGNLVFRGVPVERVKHFLRSYRVEGSNRAMMPRLLLDYIEHVEQHDSSLALWNVAVVGASGSRRSERPLGRIGRVATVRRSPLKDSGDVASIKALMSRIDLLADVVDMPSDVASMNWDGMKEFRQRRLMPPLLLLYPIDRNSEPLDVRTKATREPMGAAGDVMGLGICFPGDPDSGVEYVQTDLQPDDAVESFEGEDAIPEELTDGARE